MVEGLFLFLEVVTFSLSSAIFLVSREKEKLETREREKEKANPWLVSARQKSMHLMAKKCGVLPNRGRGGGHPEANSIFENKVFQEQKIALFVFLNS